MTLYHPLTNISLEENPHQCSQYRLEWPWELQALVAMYQVCPGDSLARLEDIRTVREHFSGTSTQAWIDLFWRTGREKVSTRGLDVQGMSYSLPRCCDQVIACEVLRDTKASLSILWELCQSSSDASDMFLVITEVTQFRVGKIHWIDGVQEYDRAAIQLLQSEAGVELEELVSKCIRLVESDSEQGLHVCKRRLAEALGLGHLLSVS